MHKGLNFQFRRCLVPNAGNVLKAQFPRQNHPAGPHAVGRCGSAVVGNAHLGGKVNGHLWRQFLRHRQHAQIGHDQRIHPCLLGGANGFRQAVHLLIGGQGVHGQIHLAAAGMGKHTALLQLLRGEIL